jgi:hypothetical protein
MAVAVRRRKGRLRSVCIGSPARTSTFTSVLFNEIAVADDFDSIEITKSSYNACIKTCINHPVAKNGRRLPKNSRPITACSRGRTGADDALDLVGLQIFPGVRLQVRNDLRARNLPGIVFAGGRDLESASAV